ncbi:MAG: polysaccharide biosynthesis/export family protein [Terriglobales bacterium]
MRNRLVFMVAAAGWLAAMAGGMAWAQAPNPLHLLHHFQTHGDDSAAAAAPLSRPVAATSDAHYIIGPGDELAIDVWQEKEISQTLPVRPDGDIALPLAGTLRASGLTPEQLQTQIASKLKAFISDPVVTVMVTKIVSQSFQVLGAVVRPGSYPLVRPTRILQALAQAGGFTPFAHPGKLTVLHWRPSGQQERFEFDYNAVIHGEKLDQDRLLQPGDTVIVP